MKNLMTKLLLTGSLVLASVGPAYAEAPNSAEETRYITIAEEYEGKSPEDKVKWVKHCEINPIAAKTHPTCKYLKDLQK